jgi:restriction endonuclease S subunit
LGRGLAAIRGRPTRFDARFLHHVLTAGYARFQARGVGSTFINISSEQLSNFAVPLFPLSEQQRIAAILDQTDRLRHLRLQTLSCLNNLRRAIFYEMFGDPNNNQKGWATHNISDFILDVSNGMTRRHKETDLGKQIVLRLRDIREGWIDFSDVNRITMTAVERSRYAITQGDVLFIRVNGNPDYVGRCSVFKGYTEPVYFNDHIMRVQIDKSTLSPEFLVFLLNSAHGKREIALHRKTSAGQHTINQEGLSKIEIPVPPRDLQAKFGERLAAIERQESIHSEYLAGIKGLFRSLQYRVFRGDLNSSQSDELQPSRLRKVG